MNLQHGVLVEEFAKIMEMLGQVSCVLPECMSRQIMAVVITKITFPFLAYQHEAGGCRDNTYYGVLHASPEFLTLFVAFFSMLKGIPCNRLPFSIKLFPVLSTKLLSR
jgi:hypothetical protein